MKHTKRADITHRTFRQLGPKLAEAVKARAREILESPRPGVARLIEDEDGLAIIGGKKVPREFAAIELGGFIRGWEACIAVTLLTKLGNSGSVYLKK